MNRVDVAPDVMVRHYKGGIYQIILIAKSSENKEEMVVYESEGGTTWVRPMTEFTGRVDSKTPRFSLL